MNIILFLLALIPSFLQSAWEELFPEEDPTSFHHVNVITGHLNLSFEDTVVESAMPLSILRTYSSAGALERTVDCRDLFLKGMRNGWLIQGGWDFFPHSHLLIHPSYEKKHYKAYLPEKGGGLTQYVFADKKGKSTICLKPSSPVINYGNLGARNNSANNSLEINTETGEATLYLSDGGYRYYKGPKFKKIERTLPQKYYKLRFEQLPSGQKISYEYDDEDRLIHIAAKGASGGHVFSWIHFHLHKTETPYFFSISTSDQKLFDYSAIEYKGRDYLQKIESKGKARHSIGYMPSRRGCGARIKSIDFGSYFQFEAEYYPPPSEEKADKLKKRPEKRSAPVDCVKMLKAPIGKDGQLIPIAQFWYNKSYTDVRDVEGCLIRYHHDGKKLHRIEYFDHQDRTACSTRFLWEGNFLKAKVFLNGSDISEFSKTFSYDSSGNVLKETLYGNLTGKAQRAFELNGDGSLGHAESVSKTYTYLPKYNVHLTVEEENGIKTEYTYLPGTDLVLSKFIYNRDELFSREFFEYDKEHFLVAHIVDDGKGTDCNDFQGVRKRQIHRFSLDPQTGKPLTVTELYYDPLLEKEVLFKMTRYTYSEHHLPIKEEVYDSHLELRFTIHTTYDLEGRILSKTSPTQESSFYTYSINGDLLTSQENGGPLCEYGYEAGRRPYSYTEKDELGIIKVRYSQYDPKGRLLSQSDDFGNVTEQSFDSFGRCLQTSFPIIYDAENSAYRPQAFFVYDCQGNVISSSNLNGETVSTSYTTYKKISWMQNPDQTQVAHIYTKEGLLKCTIQPDGSEIHFNYDPFQRLLSKELYSSAQELLEQEQWEYDSFHLLSYINAQGLKTTYSYNPMGQKIKEDSDGRVTSFEYDSLGFLTKVQKAQISFCQKVDVAGKILEKWEEDSFGNQKDYIRFDYDSRGRKTKAIRKTSLGETVDHFFYDREGRLSKHIDPLGAVTEYIETKTLNDLGQYVRQTIEIDPLGNQTIETYDAQNHLITTEKKDSGENTVFYEKLLYDRSSNLSKRVSLRYEGKELIDSRTIEWKRDPIGRITEEKLPDGTTALYGYDLRGNLSYKVLPSGDTLFYVYDERCHLRELKTSDGSLHYLYHYGLGDKPDRMNDLIRKEEIKRTYNAFGELLEEDANGLHYSWHYDELGRCDLFVLPDNSHISYLYEGLYLRSVQRRTPQGLLLYEHAYTEFTPNGQIAAQKMIADLGEIRTSYDLFDRPSHQTTPWMDQEYLYEPSRLVIEKKNSLLGGSNYAYDPLKQLVQEKEKNYSFDSLGNPSSATDSCNRLLTWEEGDLRYDLNGNLIEKTTASGTQSYTYDLLGRLSSIIDPNGNLVQFSYDPLSRLSSQKTTYQKMDYLYNDQLEMGSIDSSGTILELKVLGMGVGDIGSTIAIELNSQIFAPLHDFNGNIVALLDLQGTLVETYPTGAFGDPPLASINPWKFQSKRAIHDLIFFGRRFYDPSLKRWLTPDPAGFSDGVNLYLFVLNNPTNRLDLFGLVSEEQFSQFRLEVPVSTIQQCYNTNNLILCKGYAGNVVVDMTISFGDWQKLVFTAEEQAADRVNIMDHFVELIPKGGSQLALITFQNGMFTSYSEHIEMSQNQRDFFSEDALQITLYNTKKNPFSTIWDFVKGKLHKDTPMIKATRSFFHAMATNLKQVNSRSIWMHTMHSEAGLIGKRAVSKLPQEVKDILKEQLIVIGFGPAKPYPNYLARKAVNIYSDRDFITGIFALPYINNSNYDIRFVRSLATWKDPMLFGLIDHAFMGPTYKNQREIHMENARNDYGIYNPRAH